MRGVLCALGWLYPALSYRASPRCAPLRDAPFPTCYRLGSRKSPPPLPCAVHPLRSDFAVIGSSRCVFERSRLPHIRFPSSSPSPPGRGALNLDLIFLAGRSGVFRRRKVGVRLVWARFERSAQQKAICSNTAEREQVASRNAFASDRPGGSTKGRFVNKGSED